MLISSVGILIT